VNIVGADTHASGHRSHNSKGNENLSSHIFLFFDTEEGGNGHGVGGKKGLGTRDREPGTGRSLTL
jgi:hypothetical protein